MKRERRQNAFDARIRRVRKRQVQRQREPAQSRGMACDLMNGDTGVKGNPAFRQALGAPGFRHSFRIPRECAMLHTEQHSFRIGAQVVLQTFPVLKR
jgi:hypothetical protein